MPQFDLVPIGAVRMNRSWSSQHTAAAERYTGYKQTLRTLSKMMGYEVPSHGLSLRFYLPMPASWSEKKKAEMNGTAHQSKPDLDNMIKGFKDALCDEDSYVWNYGLMEKRWGYTGMIVTIDESEQRAMLEG